MSPLSLVAMQCEPVSCPLSLVAMQCELQGNKCDVFQGDGTKHCIYCSHHDVCHKDNQVELRGKRILVECTECKLVGQVRPMLSNSLLHSRTPILPPL